MTFYRVLHVAMLAILLTACGGGNGGSSSNLAGISDPVLDSGTVSPSEPVLRIVVLGDTGTGDDGDVEHQQYEVAEMVRKVCELRGCDFGVLAGDNFYEKGVSGVDDPLFKTAYEIPYGSLGIPFYAALGNHDNSQSPNLGEGSANTRGDYEVAYTQISPSGTWKMPARYYSQTFSGNETTEPFLQLVVLDSSPITHFFDDPSPEWSGTALAAYIAGQKSYLQNEIAASNAPWKIAVTHHPYISNGQHGNAGSYDEGTQPDPCTAGGFSGTCRGEDYKQFLEDTICDKVDVLLSGHDHELYWETPVESCGKTQFIVSGAGAKRREVFDPVRNKAHFQVGNTWGFFWLEIHQDRMIGAAYALYPDGTPYNVTDSGIPLPVFEKILKK